MNRDDILYCQNNWVPDLDPEIRDLLEPKYDEDQEACAYSGHQLIQCNYCMHGE